MLVLSLITLFVLTILNYQISKSLFYPGTVYCAAWATALACLLISGDMFFKVAPETLTVFFWGAVAFSVGSVAGLFFPLSLKRNAEAHPDKAITWGVAVLVLAFPFYLKWISGIAESHPAEFFLASFHDSFVEMMDAGADKFTPQYVFFINLLGIAPMLAMIAWAERKQHFKRAIIAVCFAVAYCILTGGRLAIFRMLIALVAIEWFSTKRLKFKPLALLGVCAALIFALISVTLRIDTEGASAEEKVHTAAEQSAIYLAAPLVAFDRVLKYPDSVRHNISVATFFRETAAKFGVRVDVPPRQSEFVDTGPSNRSNVFTIYFSYLDGGMPLACFLIAIQAFVLALIYRSAVSGRKLSAVLYAYLLPSIALSTFTELLLLDLNPTFKMSFLCFALYSLPVIKSKFARSISSAAYDVGATNWR